MEGERPWFAIALGIFSDFPNLVNITLVYVHQAPEGIHTVCKRFPLLKIVTSEIDAGLNEVYRVVPGMGEFGDRYFGTDDDGPEQMHKTPIEPKLQQGFWPLKSLGHA